MFLENHDRFSHTVETFGGLGLQGVTPIDALHSPTAYIHLSPTCKNKADNLSPPSELEPQEQREPDLKPRIPRRKEEEPSGRQYVYAAPLVEHPLPVDLLRLRDTQIPGQRVIDACRIGYFLEYTARACFHDKRKSCHLGENSCIREDNQGLSDPRSSTSCL